MRGGRASEAFLASVLACATIAGCGSPGPNPTEVPPTESVSPISDESLPVGVTAEDVEQWTAFRQFWSLRSDAAWVIAVAQDRSATLEMDAPLLQWELSKIAELDQSAQDLVLRLKNFGSRYPDDFAGVFIDGPAVVVRFAHNIEAHMAAIGQRFAETKRVRVERAAYSLGELEQIASQVAGRRALIDAVGVTFYSADVDVINNKVRVRYQGDADLDSEVRTVLGNPDWLRLETYNLSG